MIRVYNKAIRDKIPEIIEESGSTPLVKQLDDIEFLKELSKKLDEEIIEFKENNKVEELCDLIEIAYRIAELKGTSNEELDNIRSEKGKKRGKFKQNLFLMQVKEN